MMNKTDSQAAIKSPFITLPEAVKATHCPRSTILKYTKLGLFPPMVRLLGNRIAFVRVDVEQWINKRLATTARSANDE